MTYLLDTDTCSYIIKNPNLMRKRFDQLHVGDIAISAITWAELNSWIMVSTKPEQRMLRLQKMFTSVSILSFTSTDATYHGAIRKHLKDQGRMIGALDMLVSSRQLRSVTL